MQKLTRQPECITHVASVAVFVLTVATAIYAHGIVVLWWNVDLIYLTQAL